MTEPAHVTREARNAAPRLADMCSAQRSSMTCSAESLTNHGVHELLEAAA